MTSVSTRMASPNYLLNRPINYLPPTANRPTFSGGLSAQLMQLLPLLLNLLQQLSQAQKPQPPATVNPPTQTPTFVENITFDAGYPIPFTHSGSQQIPVVRITYDGGGYNAMLSNGIVAGRTSEPLLNDPNWDTHPHINGIRVKKVEYTDTLATYTLENGSVLQSNKLFKIDYEPSPVRNTTNPWQV